MDVTTKNVYSKPLHQYTNAKPMTGVKRDGYCRVPPEDSGNHSVAAVVTEQFLDFSASRGNDLRKQVGLKGGDKWCLCASRWKEAFDAKKDQQDPVVPKVALHATNEKALDVVGFKDLKSFAAPQDSGQGVESTPATSNSHPESFARPSQEIGGKEPRA